MGRTTSAPETHEAEDARSDFYGDGLVTRLKTLQNVLLAAYAVALSVWSGNIMLGGGVRWLAGTAGYGAVCSGGVGPVADASQSRGPD
jgi:hypothetical protein